MSDAHGDESPHQRPHPQPMAAPFLEFDLVRELEQLHCELPTSGQSAKTLVKYDDFRIVIIALAQHAGVRYVCEPEARVLTPLSSDPQV
jgi:hypothetical protein